MLYWHFPQEAVHVHSTVSRWLRVHHAVLDSCQHSSRPFEAVVGAVRSDGAVLTKPDALAVVRPVAGKSRHYLLIFTSSFSGMRVCEFLNDGQVLPRKTKEGFVCGIMRLKNRPTFALDQSPGTTQNTVTCDTSIESV